MLSRLERDLIAETFRSTIDEVASEHFRAKTQEHHLTARIGQALEARLNSMQILGHRLSVITQDAPDRGPGTFESRTGVDLVVDVSLGDGFSKVFFVQAKWQDSRDTKLVGQCEKMLRISDASYVWSYGPTGVKVIKAQAINHRPPRSLSAIRGRDVSSMMKRVLDCKEGDPKFGIPEDAVDRRAAITAIMEDIDAAVGVDVQLIPAHDR